jgi:hypothetical protein
VQLADEIEPRHPRRRDRVAAPVDLDLDALDRQTAMEQVPVAKDRGSPPDRKRAGERPLELG